MFHLVISSVTFYLISIKKGDVTHAHRFTFSLHVHFVLAYILTSTDADTSSSPDLVLPP
jgi:hypothetical protein